MPPKRQMACRWDSREDAGRSRFWWCRMKEARTARPTYQELRWLLTDTRKALRMQMRHAKQLAQAINENKCPKCKRRRVRRSKA